MKRTNRTDALPMTVKKSGTKLVTKRHIPLSDLRVGEKATFGGWRITLVREGTGVEIKDQSIPDGITVMVANGQPPRIYRLPPHTIVRVDSPRVTEETVEEIQTMDVWLQQDQNGGVNVMATVGGVTGSVNQILVKLTSEGITPINYVSSRIPLPREGHEASAIKINKGGS